MKLPYAAAVGLVSLLMLTSAALFAGVTGDLAGVVTDSNGAPLPGVAVTATSPQLQGSRLAVSGSAGEYTIPALPPGTYRVEFQAEGMNPAVRDNVKVSLDVTTPVKVQMAMGVITEEITVSGEAVVIDPTSTTVQQNFGTQHLKYATIGTAGRTYQAVLQQAPGVAGGANPQVMGANLGQNNYMLDGVNTTDPVTHTFGSNLPFDAIQEVSIQTLGKDAEYGRAVGGVVSVVTKTGGNEFSGTFDARITTEDLAESGDHFDADTQNYKEFKPAATLGGPISRDKVWFFVTAERVDNARTNPARPGANWIAGDRTFDGWNTLAKIVAAPAPNHSLAFRFTDNRADIDNANDSSFFRPEADRLQTQESTIYNLGYDVVINPKWLASAQVGVRRGFLESKPMNDDIDTIGVFNATTSVRWNAFTNWQGGDRDRDELLASMTYFWDRMGSHVFKAGVHVDQAKFTSFNNATGRGVDQRFCSPLFGQPAGATCGATQTNVGGTVNDIGTPAQLVVSTVIPTETFESDYQAYYIQDEWHPVRPLTLRLGLRYESVSFTTEGADTPELDRLQPRLGLAWDVFGNANTIVRGFWGEIMDDNGLTLGSFLSERGAVSSFFNWRAADSSWQFAGAFGGPTGNQFDRSLEPTYGTEASLAIAQRIGTNTSLELTAVRRESKDVFEDSCVDEDCHFYWLTNRPNGLDDVLRGEYEGYILKLESRPYSWLSGLVSYTYAKSKGSVEYTQNAGTDFDVSPDHFVNRFGRLSDDAKHRVKAAGFVRAPWGTTLGVDFSYRSGLPYNVTANLPPFSGYGTVFVEPRGSRETPSLTQLDLQVLHEFNIGRVQMGLIAAVFNALDSETATTIGGSIGNYGNCRTTDTRCIDNPLFASGDDTRPGFERLRITSTTFGTETAWQRPRRYEVGLRFEF